MATIYRVDGTLEPVTPATGGEFTLDEVQNIVGGYVELVRLTKGFFLVDEDGRYKGLPLNLQATALATLSHGPLTIVGTALHTNAKEFK
jgi:hypothetical protein